MEQETPAALRRTAEEAARLAGRVLAERFQGQRTIEYKRSRIDLVTDADKASEEVLLGFLRGRYPGHAILAEESGASQGSSLRWLIDPLDGTTNYAHHVPYFSVSIAVDGPGGVLAGVVYDPIRDELFSAARGEGATLNGQPLKTSDTTLLERALLCTGFPYDVRESPDMPVGLANHFIRHAQGIRRTGSAALDLAYVAAGRFDGFFEFRLKPWDIGAGALLVTEAGGVMTQIDGSPFDVNHGDVLASAPGLAGVLQEECRLVLAALG
jgi:myo-inositol-1(or 4)-monophosphatase